MLITTGILLAGAAHAKPAYSPASIIVKFKESVTVPRPSGRVSYKSGATIRSIDTLSQKYKVKDISPVFKSRPGLRAKAAAGSVGTGRIVRISVPAETDISSMVEAYRNDGSVEYAEPNYLRTYCAVPNDVRYDEQWALAKIRASYGWDIEQGDSSVIIGIIDSGVDYDHEDLAANIWINTAEANGLPGVDDDGNGFIDDIRGWDFTDAPGYAGYGDYLERDNDPMDDHWHGTHVAGIAAAVAGNDSGVAGVAPGCRIMALRAGFKSGGSGFLEDDDIAAALVYAADNGARVINLSLGDENSSFLLRDGIRYAAAAGCVVVAAAGNSPSEGLMYPARLTETISVGNSDENDAIGYSNYGENLDVVAPGEDILSCYPYSQTGGAALYVKRSGTSMAAPLVAGMAALVISRRPELTAEEVRTVLLNSADDLGPAGWDPWYGHGRVNLQNALNDDTRYTARILSPGTGAHAGRTGSLAVTVAAYGSDIISWSLGMGTGTDPHRFTAVSDTVYGLTRGLTVSVPVTGLAESAYTLRLAARLADGSETEDRAVIWIDTTAPVITDIGAVSRWRADTPEYAVRWETDENTVGDILFRPAGSAAWQSSLNRYRTTDHFDYLTAKVYPGAWEYRVRCEDAAGWTDSSATDTFYVDHAGPVRELPGTGAGPRSLGVHLPHGTDLDGNGRTEFVMMPYPEGRSYGPVTFYELTAGTLAAVYAMADSFAPLGTGDVDNDGRSEVFGFHTDSTVLLEADTAGQFTLVRRASFTGGLRGLLITDAAADLDGDGRAEMVFSGKRDSLVFYESTGDNTFAPPVTLGHPSTDGYSGWGNTFTAADFTGSGRPDLVTADNSGRIHRITDPLGTPRVVMIDSVPGFLETILVGSGGDMDGDGSTELVTVSSRSDAYTADPLHHHWVLKVFEADGNDSLVPVWETSFYTVNGARNGLTVADATGDGADDIVLGFYPNLYIFSADGDDSFIPAWWKRLEETSYEPFVGSGDLAGAVIVRDKEGYTMLGTPAGFPGADRIPPGLNAVPQGPSSVRITWQSAGPAALYYLYRGPAADSLTRIAAGLTDTAYTDTGLAQDVTCWYCAALADTFYPSAAVSAVPNTAPAADSLWPAAASDRHVHVAFTEPMGISAVQPGSYLLDGELTPDAVIKSSDTLFTLAFGTALEPGRAYTISYTGLQDRSGVPLDRSGSATLFTAKEAAADLTIEQCLFITPVRVRLEFSHRPAADSVRTRQFSFTGSGIVIDSAAAGSASVDLYLNRSTPLEPGTRTYAVQAGSLWYHADSLLLFAPGPLAAPVSLGRGFSDFSQLKVYPNPYKADRHPVPRITFQNVPPAVTLRLYDYAGSLVRIIEKDDSDGFLSWDMTNKSGKKVGSGVYFYYISGNAHFKKGRCAIVR